MNKSTSIAIRLGTLMLVAMPMANLFAGGPSDQTVAHRDRWKAADIGILASMHLGQLPPQPQDPSNAVEGSHAASELGKRLFNDARLSKDQTVSCATCHDARNQFQDGLPVARGVGVGSRRAMPIVGSGHSPWLFWDGRKDSLWSQALGPFEDAVEHGGNRARYAHQMQAFYRSEYEAIFGPMPDLSQSARNASPLGTPAEKAAWAAMDPKTQADVNRIFSNMGKVIAAYEKKLTHGESRFDRYVQGTVRGDPGAQQILSKEEVNGLRIFIGKGQCVTCHNGPLFTDHSFHNTGVPPRDLRNPDRGRAAAIAKVQKDEFNCLGLFSDAKPAQCQELRFIVTGDHAMEGAFRTPSLRNVALRAPYMHAGQFSSIEEVIAHYVKAPTAVVGHTELANAGAGHSERRPIRLSEQEVKELAQFLGTLSGPIVEVPWKQ